jgi:hypothetical protein
MIRKRYQVIVFCIGYQDLLVNIEIIDWLVIPVAYQILINLFGFA